MAAPHLNLIIRLLPLSVEVIYWSFPFLNSHCGALMIPVSSDVLNISKNVQTRLMFKTLTIRTLYPLSLSHLRILFRINLM